MPTHDLLRLSNRGMIALEIEIYCMDGLLTTNIKDCFYIFISVSHVYFIHVLLHIPE